MFANSANSETSSPALEAFLLGQIDFDVALGLQQRLIEQGRQRDDGQIILLVCEHKPIVTVGRGGAPGQVAMQSGPIRNGQIEVRWVNRGGGCLVHCPGQLAVYPIVPLQWHGFSVGEFLDRFRAALMETLGELLVPCRLNPPNDICGRTGQLAAIGVAIRHWVTYYGAYLNVCPPTGLFRLVENDPLNQSVMSSLVAERCGPVRMTSVRAALIRHVSERFGCDRYHMYTGHPMLRRVVTANKPGKPLVS